jgi:hypothetical protein
MQVITQEGTVAEKIGFLQKFLGYELKSAERYRRFVSLVMVAIPDDASSVRGALLETLRNSDLIADFEDAAVILMTETNGAGAISAIERYKTKVDKEEDLRFAVVTYPSDGGGPEGLLSTGYRRLQNAAAGPPGSVVVTG